MSQELYKIWVYAEAPLDMYKSLLVAGKVIEVEFECVHVKASAAHKAYGYDPGTPGEDDDDDVANGLASDPWYDDEYAGGDDVL